MDPTIQLPSAQGLVSARYYEASAPGQAAALLVGGVGGGFGSPAANLYGRLAADLPPEGVSVLRVRYRNSTNLPMAVEDVLAGLQFLRERGVHRVGLVGHSFGGAVVIRAALQEGMVRTVVTLASQTGGAERAAELHRPVLLLHGDGDEILPPSCSRRLHQLIGPEAQLRLFEGAGHALDEAADDVLEAVNDWLVDRLVLPDT